MPGLATPLQISSLLYVDCNCRWCTVHSTQYSVLVVQHSYCLLMLECPSGESPDLMESLTISSLHWTELPQRNMNGSGVCRVICRDGSIIGCCLGLDASYQVAGSILSTKSRAQAGTGRNTPPCHSAGPTTEGIIALRRARGQPHTRISPCHAQIWITNATRHL